MRANVTSWMALALTVALVAGPAAPVVLATGEGLVRFEDLRSAEDKSADPDDMTTGLALLELYRKQYNKPDATPQDEGYDAFRTYQATVSEFLMKPDLHKEAEENFNKLVRDGSQEPNLYYISTWAASSTTSYDGSGNIRARSRGLTDPDLGLEGKKLYFPSEEALQKILEITKATKEAADQVSNSDPATLEEFFKNKEELEKKLLTVMAEEIAKMRDLAQGEDVFGMGWVDKDGNPQPLRLNLDVLKDYMADRSIPIPAPRGEGGETSSGGRSPGTASSTTRTPIEQPVQAVTIPEPMRTETNLYYDKLFVGGDLPEHERTKLEIQGDMFRMRGLPGDTGSKSKTYDPVMTFEYQQGGLNLPSSQPEE